MHTLLVVLLAAYCHVFHSSGEAAAEASQLAYLPYQELTSGAGSLPAADDGVSSALPLPSHLPFKHSNQTTAFISTNGLISFGESFVGLTGDRNSFPNLSQFLVAPYWVDVDLRQKGRVAYEIFTSSNSIVVQSVNKFLADNQTLLFTGTWALVASWEDTCPFLDRRCEKTKPNTFQVVITSDGLYSYAVVTYECGDINWTGFDADQLNPSNPVVGFQAGQGVHGSHYLSYTPDVINIACLNLPSSNWSNVVFQLSQEGAPLRIGITAVMQSLLLAVSGDTVNILFSLSGSSPLQIRWLFTAVNGNTTALSSPQHTLNGTSLVLHLSEVTLLDAGTYTVTVVTKKNSATASAELAVQAPPTLVNSSFPDRANKGDTVQFVCTFYGYPAPQAVFMKDGAVISSSLRFNVTPADTPIVLGSGQGLVPASNEGSHVSITLTISPLEISDAGDYTCLATNQLAVTRQVSTSSLLAVYDPAHITTSSTNFTVNETDAVTLHCWAVGFPAPSITWSLVRSGQSTILTDVLTETVNGTGGSQLMRTQVVLSSVQVEDGGVYMCHASNTVPGSDDVIGIAVSSFSLTVQTVPRVTPAGGVLTIVELEGDTAMFRFLVERDNPPFLPEDVHWTVNGAALNETDPRYSFSTDRLTMDVSALTRSDQGYYKLIVRNPAGVNSSSVTLDVQFPPKITTLPPALFVRLAGDSIILSCPTSADPPALVVWRHSNTTVTDLVLSQQSTAFFLTNITLSDAGLYVCTVSNQHGNDSAEVTIQVQVPVQLTLTPQSHVEAVANSTLNLTCQARGYPVPSITWYKDNTPLNEAVGIHTTMSGIVATSQLVFESTQLSDNGIYECQATNTLAAPTMQRSNISFHVLHPPSVKVSSPHLSVEEMSTAVLSCTGFGVPLPQLTWSRADGREIAGQLNQSFATDEDGRETTTLELSLDNAASNSDGVFICSGKNNVTNLLQSPEEAEIILTVLVSPRLFNPSGPSITFMVQRDTSLQQNITLNFSVAKATPAILPENVSWFFNFSSSPYLTRPLLPNQRIIFSSDRLSVTLIDVVVIDTGSYTIRVDNGVGVAEVVLQLIVTAEPRISSPLPGGPVSVVENDEIQFTCNAVGLPPPVIIWTKNGQPIDHRGTDRVSIGTRQLPQDPTGLLGTMSTLTISQTLLDIDNGEYQCKANNGVGLPATLHNGYLVTVTQAPIPQYCVEAGQPCRNGGTCRDTREDFLCQCTDQHYGRTCELNVFIQTAPQFTAQPQNTSRPLNSMLALSCSVSGIPTPRVQWYKDSQPVTDGDSDDSVFTIRELGLKNRGFYHCVAENPSDEIVSSVAVVNIDNVVQYKALMVVPNDNIEEFPDVVRETNEFVAGYLLDSDTSLFFIQLTNDEPTNSNTSRMAEVVITIVTEEGGSDQLLEQVQQGLGSLRLDRQVTFKVEDRFDGCRSTVTVLPSSSRDPDRAIRLSWPETNIGETAVLKCPCGTVTLGPGNLQATRYCGGSFSDGAKWAVENSAACNFSDRAREICSLAMLAVDQRVSRLGTLTESVTDFAPSDVSVTGAVLIDSADGVGGNTSLTDNYLKITDNLLNVNAVTMKESQLQANTSSRMLESIETVTASLPVEGNEMFVLKLRNMIVTTQSIVNSGGVTFSIDDDDTTTEKPSISVPSSVLDGMNSSSLRITNAAFLNDNFFQTEREQTAITTVLSATVQAGGRTVPVRNLTESVRLVLPRGSLSTRNATTDVDCVFWDFQANGGKGDWSTRGCTKVRDNATEDFVVCECDHLTNFALLLDVSPRPPNGSTGAVGVALTAVSYIGVIVSIVCLIATIVTYSASRQLRSTEHGKLLINLCSALLGLYFSYIFAIHGTAVPALCAIFSMLLHYFFLVTFFSMAAEAVNLYMKLVVVLGSQISNYVLKAVLITWILPAVIVLFCFAPNPSNYIGTHFCRAFGVPFYIGLLVPFLIIYVFNWVMFAVIMLNLVCKDCKSKYKETNSREKKMSIRQQLLITATLSILFGLGWGIGLPATQELHQTPAVRDTFAAFFIILTTFQGLFVFLMHCLRSLEARKLWSQWIFKATGKDVDLTLSTSVGSSNYWKKRRQQKHTFNSTASQGTSVTYASTSGTLKRQVERIQREEEEAGYSMAPLDSPTFDEEFDVKVSTQFDTEESCSPDIDEHPQVVIERSSGSSSREDTSSSAKTIDMSQQQETNTQCEGQEQSTAAAANEDKVEGDTLNKDSDAALEKPAEEIDVASDEQTAEDQKATVDEAQIETVENHHKTTAEDHETTAEDHETTAEDHERTAEDHETTAEDHETTAEDHETTAEDHETTAEDHETTAEDHETTAEDHKATVDEAQIETVENHHKTTAEDHETTVEDHNATTEKVQEETASVEDKQSVS